MQDSKDITSLGTPTGNGTSETIGFKFNKVGREDAATTVYKPQVDSGTALRRTLIIVALIGFFALVGYISWDRSGRFNPFEEQENGKKFTVPERSLP